MCPVVSEVSQDDEMGVLRIHGVIELGQFWPQRSSDADTSKVRVSVGEDSFAYSTTGKTFKVTRVFDDAFVRGAAAGPVIEQGRITVRLQGIDAPELHYRAPALKSNRPEVTPEKRKSYNQQNRPERRQYLGETATVALSRKLQSYGTGEIACKVISLVDHPYEVIDTYGRFVGNVRVGSRFRTDLNLWLAAQGWVYPTFYSSMTNPEIEALLAAMIQGKKKPRAWKHLSFDTDGFDPTLVYRGEGAPLAPDADIGPVLMPKVFRRQVAYEMEKAAGIFSGSFKTFLARSPDGCFLLKDFLAQSVHSAPYHTLHEFLDGTKLTKQPQELVFREKYSTLVDSAGRVIEQF